MPTENAAPSNRLTLLFDGTDNTQTDNTNVWRLCQLLADVDASGTPQRKLYIQGVGTDVGRLARGSIFGTGVIDRICKGYRWLSENYQDGDHIFVFGFSRGAFAARSLVQMVSNCGLVAGDHLHEWKPGPVFDRYEAISRQESELLRPLWRLRRWQRHPEEAPPGWRPDAREEFLLDATRVSAVKIRMTGLWDTVGAIGTDALQNEGSRTQKSAAHNVRPTAALQSSYHALAIDEHRPMFDATLWRRFVPVGEDPSAVTYKDYEQRWFVGAHSDVGGGYSDGHLHDISLDWMLGKAKGCGLAFDPNFSVAHSAASDQIHDSFEKFAGGILNIWNMIMPGDQRHYREINKQPREVATARGERGSLVTINETLDPSALQRWRSDAKYRPRNLVDFLQRHPEQTP